MTNDYIRIDQLFILWQHDQSGGEESFGCYAKAEVSYSTNDPTNIATAGSRRLEWFRSGGLWDIDSPDADYRRTIEREELADLREHLSHFGIVVDDVRWVQLLDLIRRQP